MIGCYLTEDRIDRLKDIADRHGMNFTELMVLISDEGMDLLERAGVHAMNKDAPEQPSPGRSPMDSQPVARKRAINRAKRTQNPLPAKGCMFDSCRR